MVGCQTDQPHFSLLRQHETETLGPVAIVESRAYHNAGDLVPGVNILRAS
jgi:hypothetical protein